MAGTGDIAMSSNFNVSTQRPFDARHTVADLAGRNALATVKRYDGLETYLEDTKQTYRMVLGTVDTDLANNSNWVETTIILGTTNVSEFVNDANYVAEGDNISVLVNDSNYTASGDNISVFTNDSGYLTTGTLPSNIMVEGENVSLLTNDAGYVVGTLQATESDLGMAELATQTETDAGTDDLRIVTPLKLRTTEFVLAQIPDLPGTIITSGTVGSTYLPQATEGAKGAAELATQAEVDTGTNALNIVTPATLQSKLNDDIVLPGAWATPTLNGSWVNTDVQYRFLDPYLIQIRGSAVGDALTAIVFTLPNGFRPITIIKGTVTQSTAVIIGFTINTNGTVVISAPANLNHYFNIIFPID